MFSRGGSLLPSLYADARYIDAVIVSKIRKINMHTGLPTQIRGVHRCGAKEVSRLGFDDVIRHLVKVTHGYTVQGVTKDCWSNPSVAVPVFCQPAAAGAGAQGAALAAAAAAEPAVSQQPFPDDGWNPVEKRPSFAVPMDQAGSRNQEEPPPAC